MDIIQNKALLLRARNPNVILDTIPKSKAVGENEVVVYCCLLYTSDAADE